MARRRGQSVETAADALRRQIDNGDYAVGQALPPEISLVKELGFSRGTIRRAIEALIESGDVTRRRHSSPTVAPGRSTASPKDRNIYVWVSTPVAHEPTLEFFKGVSQALSGTPYRMVVSEPSRFAGSVIQADERQFLRDLMRVEDMAGAILERDPFADHAELMADLVSAGKRLVFVDVPPPEGVRADFVGTANATAARDCVEHLLNLGHSRVACVTDTDIPLTNQDRIRGYWRAMKHAGLESLGHCLVAPSTDVVEESELPIGGMFAGTLGARGYFSSLASRCVGHILAMDPRPTGLFVTCDALALWMCAVLEGAGVQVPSDMSVIGFDWLAR